MTTLRQSDPGAPSRAARLRPPLAGAAVVAVMTLALHLRDPHRAFSWGICPTKLLTGLDCPGCGGLRAVNDLTNGHLVAALSSNALFVVSVPLILAYWLRTLLRAWRGAPTRLSEAQLTRITTAYLVLAVVFMIVRNTPWGHWLHS